MRSLEVTLTGEHEAMLDQLAAHEGMTPEQKFADIVCYTLEQLALLNGLAWGRAESALSDNGRNRGHKTPHPGRCAAPARRNGHDGGEES